MEWEPRICDKNKGETSIPVQVQNENNSFDGGRQI